MAKEDLILLIEKQFPGASNIVQVDGGGNGTPFKFDKNGEKYLIKIIDTSKSEQELLGQEEDALKRINSEYVVKLLDEGMLAKSKHKYLLFPYIQGKDLSEIIFHKKKSGQKFSDEEILKIARQVAAGICDLWNGGVAHQDIKPRNIRVTDDYSVTILDLGIARFRDEPRKSKGKGSYKYSSPQQILSFLGGEHSLSINQLFSSDHFALGVILYEMSTLNYPFGSGVPDDIANVVPPRVSTINPQVDSRIEHIIHKLIEKEAHKRYYTPSRLLASLKSEIETSNKIINEPTIFFQHGSSPTGYLYLLTDYHNKLRATDTNLVNGIICSGSQLPSADNLQIIPEKFKYVIIDPETYLLVFPEHINSKVKKFSFGKKPLSPKDFVFNNYNFVMNWVKDVIEFQIEKGANILLAPYFIVENHDDYWKSINEDLLSQAAKYIKDSSINLPLFAPVATSRSLICSEASRGKILDNLMFRDDIHGVYLIVETERDGSLPLADSELITALSSFIGIIERRFSVVLPNFDMSAMLLIANGLSAFGTNHDQSLRKFSIAKLHKDKPEPSKKVVIEKVFSPKLLNFIRFTGEADLLIKQDRHKGIFNTDSPFFAKINPSTGEVIWSKGDRANYYLLSASELINEMTRMSKSDCSVYVKDKIISAQSAYLDLAKQRMQLHIQSKGDFLNYWDDIDL